MLAVAAVFVKDARGRSRQAIESPTAARNESVFLQFQAYDLGFFE